MTFSGAAIARWIAPFLTVAAVAAVGAVSAPVHPADTPAVRLASDANPLAGMPFYVNPQSKGMRAAQGNPDPLLAAVVNTPTAYWMDLISTPAVDAKYIAAAQAAGTMPILALYGIPNRDCGSYAAGGFGSAGSYRAWIDGVAAAIGTGPAAVILEPDALAMIDCLSPGQQQERLELIGYAVDTLTRNPATAVCTNGKHAAGFVRGLVYVALANAIGALDELPEWIGRTTPTQTWAERRQTVSAMLERYRDLGPQDLYDNPEKGNLT